MKGKFLALVLCIVALTQIGFVNACLNYDQMTQRCSLCPFGMHMHKGNCLYDIPNCLEYHQGADCKKCSKGYKLINRVDRIECIKLQLQQTSQYTAQQIDPSLPQDQTHELRQNFYTFLNGYLLQKYKEHQIDCKLMKLVDKGYKNGQREVVIIYKTSQGTVEKTTVGVIGNYKSFELKETVLTTAEDISEDEILVFENDKLSSKVKPQVSQLNDAKKQTESQQVPNKQTTQQLTQQAPTSPSSQQIKQTSDFNYQYQKPESRQKDIGFQTSNEFIRLSNSKILNDEAKVVGCFMKSSGLRKHYRIFYKTVSQEIYEGEVIYDVVRRRAYILNFGKQFSV